MCTEQMVLVLSIHSSYLLVTETAVIASIRGSWIASMLRLEISNYTANEIKNLSFKNRASYIWDGRTATLQMLHFIYFFNKYKYWVF